VCETLNFPGAVVPPAGVIEVILSPTGGVYGWVKDTIGRFNKGVPEPFEGTVTGIGKTECRLVGPNAVTPEQLAPQLAAAPFRKAVLIEGTASPGE
jgi:hypothetical protein